jgi:hypothetical protein
VSAVELFRAGEVFFCTYAFLAGLYGSVLSTDFVTPSRCIFYISKHHHHHQVGPYSTVSSGEKKNTEVLTYRGAGVDMNFCVHSLCHIG